MKQEMTSGRGLLLDDLADRLQCLCLSDLKTEQMRQKIGEQLEQIDAFEYTLAQWQEAADYLLNQPQSVRSSAEAKKQLLDWCNRA